MDASVKRIVILGTGGTCIDILDTLYDVNRARATEVYRCVGFLDDDPAKWGTRILGVEVLGPLDSAARYEDCRFINGIGSPSSFWRKESVIGRTGVPLDRFETVVHPTASISATSRLGRGTVVFQNASITNNVRVGDQVVVLPNSVVSHDSVVGDFSCVAGGVCVSGDVRIGRSCYLGAGSVLRNGITVRDYSLIGMGSVVLADVPEGAVVVGNPARFLRTLVRHPDGEHPAAVRRAGGGTRDVRGTA